MRWILISLLGVLALRADEPSALFIEGYAGQRSVAQGEEIALYVSTSAAKYEVEIARLGGMREVVWKKSGIA
jgi:hypothetical protein